MAVPILTSRSPHFERPGGFLGHGVQFRSFLPPMPCRLSGRQRFEAAPVHLFTPIQVRNRLLDEHPALVRDMKRAGMSFSNMCALMFT